MTHNKTSRKRKSRVRQRSNRRSRHRSRHRSRKRSKSRHRRVHKGAAKNRRSRKYRYEPSDSEVKQFIRDILSMMSPEVQKHIIETPIALTLQIKKVLKDSNGNQGEAANRLRARAEHARGLKKSSRSTWKNSIVRLEGRGAPCIEVWGTPVEQDEMRRECRAIGDGCKVCPSSEDDIRKADMDVRGDELLGRDMPLGLELSDDELAELMRAG